MTTQRDIPGVIAPPPLIYIGFLILGWALFRFAATPDIVGPGAARWLGLGMAVPREDALDLDQPHVLTVQRGGDARAPVVGEGGELVGQVDGRGGGHGRNSSSP